MFSQAKEKVFFTKSLPNFLVKLAKFPSYHIIEVFLYQYHTTTISRHVGGGVVHIQS